MYCTNSRCGLYWLIGLFIAGAILLAGCNQTPPPSAEDDTLQLANPDLPAAQTTPGGENIQDQVNRQIQQQQQAQQQAQQQQLPPTQPPQSSEDGANFPKRQANAPDTKTMMVTTQRGEIVIDLYADKAPNSITNFMDKAESGFYDDLKFHRVEDWVVQGGDPRGDGTGGGEMETEINDMPFKQGSVGVARGNDINISNDSQFFICTSDCSWLTGQYTNIGEVSSGLEVAQEIQIGDLINGIQFE